jgi:hypothetical protein
MLGLDGAKAIEALLIDASHEAERIPKSKRRLGTKGILKVHVETR